MAQNGGEIEQRLKALGFTLPQPAAPIANYVPAVVTGNLLFISGQLPFGADGTLAPAHVGSVGRVVSEQDAVKAAALSGLNCLAQAKLHIGDLARISRCVRLGGFIHCDADFTRLAAVMNGASDLIGSALAEFGAHARSTIGVAQLPLGSCVEVEAIFEIAE